MAESVGITVVVDGEEKHLMCEQNTPLADVLRGEGIALEGPWRNQGSGAIVDPGTFPCMAGDKLIRMDESQTPPQESSRGGEPSLPTGLVGGAQASPQPAAADLVEVTVHSSLGDSGVHQIPRGMNLHEWLLNGYGHFRGWGAVVASCGIKMNYKEVNPLETVITDRAIVGLTPAKVDAG